MTTNKEEQDRLRMPGEEPTDADLRTDAELTRQELAETVAALGDRTHVKDRVQAATRQRMEQVEAAGTGLVGKLPDPVAQKLLPVWVIMIRRPAIPLGGIAAAITALMVWSKVRNR
ncbi:MAG TPA: DUF3618 domain-containing protein [Actinophytocola sp.]|jgi:hypothetical protein|uniref:DUF3618 domain-containing protein n=1 Tax=Actinophytocola sp. TaxID=1872138 RepID=UPI002F91F559